ncbi:hypothetical protein TZ53_10945 [Sphingobium sp. YBL2]|nr:hypothetical protein TZ53_10945 [Sphingobium sp. YBL2]
MTVACDMTHMIQQCTHQRSNPIGREAAVVRVDAVSQMSPVPLPIRRQNLRESDRLSAFAAEPGDVGVG